MAGLLDGGYTPDPLAQGLLGLGSALLTPRQLGGGLMAGANAFNQGATQAAMLRRQMAQDAMQQQLMGLRMSEAEASAAERKRKQDEDARLLGAAQGAYTKAVPDTWEGPGTPGGFDRQKYVENLYAGGFPMQAMQVEKSQQQDTPYAKIDPSKFTPESLQAFAATGGRDPSVLRPFVAPEKPPAPSEISKLLAEQKQFAPGSPEFKAIGARIEALNYRQPPASMNVSYGAPFPATDPTTGLPGMYQPSNRGGPPVALGLAPPPQPGKDLPEGAAKQVTGARNLRDAISKYKGALQNWDRFSVVSPAKVAEMDTLYNNMMLQAKEAYNLGVLNGPDYEIMTRVVTPPASFKGVMYGSPALAKQADTLSGIATSIERQVVGAHPGRNAGGAPSAPSAASGGFSSLPAAKDFAGKIARDTQSGKRFRSDGTKWVEVQ